MRRIPALLLALLILAAAWVLLRPSPSYSAQQRDAIDSSASHAHPAGTDSLGRDRLVRTSAAALLGLAGATLAAALTTLIAAIVGTFAGFAPPALESLLLLLSDTFLALPWLFLLMIVPLRTSVRRLSAGICHGDLSAPRLAGLASMRARRPRRRKARPLGRLDGPGPGLWPSPTAASPALCPATPAAPARPPVPHLSIPACVVAEANLGTLGLGVAEPLPSWGSMLLELDNSATLATTHWVYLPLFLLVTLLLLLELTATEA